MHRLWSASVVISRWAGRGLCLGEGAIASSVRFNGTSHRKILDSLRLESTTLYYALSGLLIYSSDG